MERVFLPMAMWPMEPRMAVDMRLESTQVDQMMTSIVSFGQHIGLRSVESDSYHVAAPMSGVAESRIGLHEPIETTQERAAVFPLDMPIDIRWRADCAQMRLHFPRAALELRLEQHLDRPLNKPIVFSPAMDLTTPKRRSWVRMLRLANREARREQELLGHPLAANTAAASCDV